MCNLKAAMLSFRTTEVPAPQLIPPPTTSLLVCGFCLGSLTPVCISCSVVSNSLQPHGLWPARLLCPWNSPGKNTGLGCHFLLQRIFPTQELNLNLLHCTQILYPLSYEGSPEQLGIIFLYTCEWTVHGMLQARILEWVTIPFSRGSFQPRVSNPGFFTSWATREAPATSRWMINIRWQME